MPEQLPRPIRVLVGNLEPVVRLGMVRALEENGCQVVGHHGAHMSHDIVRQAQMLRPDAVVLDLDDGAVQELGRQVQTASPRSKLILWARDEHVMEVVDPGASVPRLIVDAVPEELQRELSWQTPMEE